MQNIVISRIYKFSLTLIWPSRLASIFSALFFVYLAGSRVDLTHWGQVTHIFVSKLTITRSDNGLSAPNHYSNQCWNFFEPLGTTFSEIVIEIHIFSFMEMHFKMSSAKWWPFCLGLNVLTWGSDPLYTLLNHMIWICYGCVKVNVITNINISCIVWILDHLFIVPCVACIYNFIKIKPWYALTHPSFLRTPTTVNISRPWKIASVFQTTFSYAVIILTVWHGWIITNNRQHGML